MSLCSLLAAFYFSKIQKYPIKTILFIFSIKDLPVSGPVGSWLSELKNVHESECTIMLQSKPVRRSDCDSVKEGVTEIKEKIRQSGHLGSINETRGWCCLHKRLKPKFQDPLSV